MSSSSNDETDNEEKEEKMKLSSKQRHENRKKRESKQKKKSKKYMRMISMSSSQLRRISNSKKKERPKSLKEHLIEYLKEKKDIEDIKARLEKKEEQRIQKHYLKYKGERARVKEEAKEIGAIKQERKQPKKMNKKQKLPLRRPHLKKRKGIDRNGNILKSYPYNTFSKLVQPIDPMLNLGHIDKGANEFEAINKNLISEYTNSVIESNSVNHNGIDDSTSKESQIHDLTNDDILLPYSDMSTDSDIGSDNMTQEDEYSEIQESNYFKIYLEKNTRNNLYRIKSEKFQESRLYEKSTFGRSFGKETESQWDRIIEERYQNLEMGRKIFENAYRFIENREDDDEESEFEKKKRATGAKDKSKDRSNRSKKRTKKKEETFIDSRKKKAKEIDIYIDVKTIHPRDLYLSSLPHYTEYKTEVHVPKSCIEHDLSTYKHSAQSADEITYSENSDKEESKASIERPVSKHQKTKKPSDDKTNKKTETKSINEKCQISTLNPLTLITKYISSIRHKYEKEKRIIEKNRSYQDLENERKSCQKRINRELELFRKLADQRYSEISSSEDLTDDEAAKKIKKSFTEVNGRGEKKKNQETKRSSSPILIYHYYRPDFKSKDDTTYYDSDGCVPEPNNWLKTHKVLRTPLPLTSANDNKPDEKVSEETKSNKHSLDSLPSQTENQETVLNQLKKEEETLDHKLQNIKSKANNEKLKIHYDPMTITFDARSVTNSNT
ncbi:hypothetical protein RR46_06686 [Papilio xuthus]|uniref:Uncharacterized protein n=1 Tax=Papilio xuthus TaxID=66420 RepID=A0A194PSX9_PAPXU|nr:hypothetical protein RR46_06686 [Papilio xuthus]